MRRNIIYIYITFYGYFSTLLVLHNDVVYMRFWLFYIFELFVTSNLNSITTYKGGKSENYITLFQLNFIFKFILLRFLYYISEFFFYKHALIEWNKPRLKQELGFEGGL